MIADAELDLIRQEALVEPNSLVDEIIRLKQAIRGHRNNKRREKMYLYNTYDVELWSGVDE